MTEVMKATQDAVRRAANCIRSGGLVVVPTHTNYNVVCDPFDEKAVQRVFQAKGRTKFGPLTLYLPSAEEIPDYTLPTPAFSLELARALWPREISFILYKRDNISDAVTCGASTIAVACHDQPVLQGLMAELGGPVCGSSANLSGQGDIHVDLEKASHDLQDRVDMILDDGPTKAFHYPSEHRSNTIVDFTFSPPFLVRIGFLEIDVVLKHIPDLVVDVGGYKAALRERMAEAERSASA